MDHIKELREDFVSRNLLGVSGLISRMIPPPPEGKAFLVGGIVRDLFCLVYGPPDLLDVDLCFTGDVSKWSTLIARQCSVEVTFEPRFKTARFWIRSGSRDLHMDIAMARSEVYENPGSLPIVTPATCKEDLGRRDFSINAMAWPLEEAGYCRESLIDPFGGRSDIRSGVLRILHKNSFRDDPTRLFRGFRLLSRLSFQWETETQALVEEAIFEKNILLVSGARIRKEFVRVFLEKDPVDVLKRIYVSGLMEALVPKARWSEVLESSLMEAVSLSRMIFGGETSSLLPLQWASIKEWCHGETFFYLAILKGLQEEDLVRAIKALGLVGKTGLILKEAILDPSAFSRREMQPVDFLRIVCRHLLDAGLLYGPMACEARTDGQRHFLAMLSVRSGKNRKEAFLSGEDLIGMGIPPGKRVGEILRDVEDGVREGRITSREEALHWVRKESLRS